MWRAKLSGEFGTNDGMMIIVEEEEEVLFWKMLALGCGETISVGSGLDELIGLALMADRSGGGDSGRFGGGCDGSADSGELRAYSDDGL